MSILKGRRIFVGPNDIGSIASRMASALAANGASVFFFDASMHAFYASFEETENLRRLFPRAMDLVKKWKQRSRLSAFCAEVLTGFVKFAVFCRMCFWAETLVMIGGKGFFFGGLEYAFFRMLGKRVVHVFVGTASRPRYLSGYSKDVLRGDTINAKLLKRLAHRTKRQAQRIGGISRHASIVVENPLCGHFHERPFVNWFKLGAPLDLAALERKPLVTDATPPRTPGKLRVLHSPSRAAIKGSERIQTVMNKLIVEGLPLEFRQISGVPHGQVLHEISQADFVIDQLYSDSPLAGFAAEASAFRKAAIVGGYGWKLFPDFLKADEMPPTAYCHPDELENYIRTLTQDAARRDAVGRQSRAFLETQWSEAAYAARFARIVAGDIPADWMFAPAQVRYTHGLGLEESEVRTLVGALIDRFGPGSLQVSHIPGLEAHFAAFAAKRPASKLS